jgi:ABC-type nitrate/sulfonate/bicarbonate transport system ATPase subunit
LHITHSRTEARALADHLLVIESRRVTERPLAELAARDDQSDATAGSSAAPAIQVPERTF